MEYINSRCSEYDIIQNLMFEVFNNTDVYMLILDSDLKIKMINQKLVSDLGHDNKDEFIGKSCLEFLNNDIKREFLYRYLNKSSVLKETTSKIHTKDSDTITIKWVPVKIEKFDVILCIGFKTKSLKNDIENEEYLRSYYRELIQKDRSMIQSTLDVVYNK